MKDVRNPRCLTEVDVFTRFCSECLMGAFYVTLVAMGLYVVLVLVGFLVAGVYWASVYWWVTLPLVLLAILSAILNTGESHPPQTNPTPISHAMVGQNPGWNEDEETSREWVRRVFVEHKLEEQSRAPISEDQIVRWLSATPSMSH